jgi:hypothetical protein
MTPAGEIIGTWVAVGLTLMMFSFIYRDNLLFKIGEHLYLGITVGYYVNIQYWQIIVPDVYRAITIQHQYWVIVPAILGVFIILRLVPSLSWLSRMSFAFIIGGGAGLAIPNVIDAAFLPQVYQTLRPFNAGLSSNLNQLFILVGVFTVLMFFFFSLEHKKFVGGISKVGLYFIMVSFGTSFGMTVMARISLLIGRFQFLIYDFFYKLILHKTV